MLRRDLVRRTAAGALVTLALAAMTACGGDDSDAEPSSPSVASGTSTSDGASGDSSEDASPDTSLAPEAGKSVDPDEFLEVFATALEKATTAHTTMSMTGDRFSMEADGDVDYTSDPPDVSMKMESDEMGGQLEARMLDGVMYLQMPLLGEKWVQMDLSDPQNPLGDTFGDAFDLGKVVENFRTGLRSATLVGDEEVDGESLTHYRVTLDPSAVADELAPSEPSADVPETVDYDLWFDDDGLFRRMEADLGPDDGTMTMEFSDWGEDVTIEAPPASDVNEVPGAPQG